MLEKFEKNCEGIQTVRDRKEIENGISWNRNTGNYIDDANLAVNLNLENVMGNLGLVIEVLLDIRDILKKHDDDVKESRP